MCQISNTDTDDVAVGSDKAFASFMLCKFCYKSHCLEAPESENF